MTDEPFMKGLALSPHESFLLDTLCRPISDVFGQCYLVGSVMRRRDPRDIDIRCMVEDDDPLAQDTDRRRVLNSLISMALGAQTGMRIDFQFQGTTEGNEIPDQTPRSALGLGYERRSRGRG